MGRIAEALKKAEEERAAAAGLSEGTTVGQELEGFASDRIAGVEVGADHRSFQTPTGAEDDGEHVSPAERSAWIGRVSPSLVALNGQDTILVEQYRALRTRLASQNPRTASRVLTITSSVAGEGKSVTTANLAVVMAEVRHHRVLVLDADFRHNSMAGLLAMAPKPGLVEVLQGKVTVEQVVQRTPIPNLGVIAAGATKGVNPAELLSSKRAAAVFDDLRDRYSYVLVDTPPSCDLADAGIVGQLADGVVVVVRIGRTPQPVVKRIVQTLQASQVNLIGCVLTGMDSATSRYGYYGYPTPGEE